MKFLICGLGSTGYRHLKKLRKLGSHEIWAYRTGKSTIPQDVQESTRPDKIFNDLDEALDLAPDAVIVTNPTALHMPVLEDVVARGIAAFVEKPLSHDLLGVKKLLKDSTEKDVPVLVGFNLLYHPAMQKIKSLLEEGLIGRPISATAHWGSYMPEWHPWEDYRTTYAACADLGGGVVLTMSHELNYLTDFFGTVIQTKAMELKGNTLGITADEGVCALLEHESGVVSNVSLNFLQRHYRRDLEIMGDKGTLYWDFNEPQLVFRFEDKKEVFKFGDNCDDIFTETYTTQMKHFIEVVKRTVAPRIPLSKSVDDLKLCVSILKEIGR